MITVKELIDFLQDQPADNVIQVNIDSPRDALVEIRTVVKDVAFKGDYTLWVDSLA